MQLTGGQVTRVLEAGNRWRGQLASRGGAVHSETETFVQDILDIVGEAKSHGPSASNLLCNRVGCVRAASFIIHGEAVCQEHRA